MDQLEEEGLLLAVYVMYCVILVVLVASIALCLGEKQRGQRYRYFYSTFSSLCIAVPLVESTYFYFKYLSLGLAIAASMSSLIFAAVCLFIRKASLKGANWAWVVLSLPLLPGGWTIPLFIWNLYYAFGLQKQKSPALVEN